MKKLYLLIFLIFSCVNAQALMSDRVTFDKNELNSETEENFFNDLDDGKLDRHDYYEAFIIASDITKHSDYIWYREELLKIKKKMLKAGIENGDPYIEAKNLLFWLHENVFKEYKADATLASDIVDNGEFNCLSASILYCILANDLGLNVKGVIVKDHAFCMLLDSRGDKDIETTIRYGFDPGAEEIEQLKELTRYVYVPRKDYGDRRIVNTMQLIGALYSNLGSIFSQVNEEKIDYEKDLPKYKKGFYFDPESNLFNKDISACLNNNAVKYMEENKYDKAYMYIRQAKKFEPKNEDFINLEKKYFSERGITETKAGNFEKGISYLKIALEIYPEDGKLLNNLSFCYVSWGNAYFEKKDFQNAAIVFAQGLNDMPKDEVLLGNAKASYYNLAVKKYKEKNYAMAIKYADKGLELFPGDKDLTEIKQASQGFTWDE